jgi:di/tricarboxylate transporter
MPNAHAVVVLVITLGAFYLYTRAWIRMELVSLLILTALLLEFYLFPLVRGGAPVTETRVLQAFGHPALIAICSLMILGRGLTMTGAMEPVARVIARVWAFNRWLGLLITLVLAATASAFVNDTPVLVLLLPMLLSLAQRTGYAASRTLMPVNFAILAGGMLTSIGTSTNLLVLSIATDLGMEPMGLFDFTGIAFTAFLVALPYLWLVAPHLLPPRTAPIPESLREFEARAIVAGDNQRLVGRQLAELSKTLGRPFPVQSVGRAGQTLPPTDDLVLAEGDELRFIDKVRGLGEVGVAFRVDLFNPEGEGRFLEVDTGKVDVSLAEVVIGTDSEFIGRTLRQIRFAETFKVVVVGISRGTEGLLRDGSTLSTVQLEAGDVLLVQGPDEQLEALRNVGHLMLLTGQVGLPRSPLAPWALGIMAAVVVVAATKLLPIHVAAFIGVIAMLAKGCVKLHGVGRALSLQVVLLVVSSIALGQALVETGAADWVAGGVVVVVQNLPPTFQLVAFMTFGAVLTNFVSNSAAAAVGTPIAVATASQLGSPLEPFVLSILFGANLSYATPMAYQTNVLVMNAAGYTFGDFVRVGVPLVLLMLVTLSVLLVRNYGL